jgi:hypothetical protein
VSPRTLQTALVLYHTLLLYILIILYYIKSQYNSIGIATGYGLDDRMIGIRFPAGLEIFSLRHRIQTGYGAHPASYAVDTVGSP